MSSETNELVQPILYLDKNTSIIIMASVNMEINCAEMSNGPCPFCS